MTNAYQRAVEQTFIGGLRNVFLVDDAFPTFADLHAGGRRLRKFKERKRAANLYRSFRERHLPCDFENTFRSGDLNMVERMRKCDLIVIDLHLDATDTDPSRTLHILRRLADSDHFNTVVVYTKKEELNEVWLDVAANLRPDLCDSSAAVRNSQAEEEWWAAADPESIEPPSEDAVASFLLRGSGAIGQERKRLIEDLRKAGAPDRPVAALEAFLRYHVGKRQARENKKLNEKSAPAARRLQGRFAKDKPYWVQANGCFVVIVNKSEGKEGEEADQIFDRLLEALLDWNPNFFQMLISEIQNRLELEALATDSRSFSDPTLQTALSHYLLDALQDDPDENAVVESAVARVVETVRSKISGDKDLRKFARTLLAERTSSLEAALADSDPIRRAAAFAHMDKPPPNDEVLFFLNSFLSSETFNRSRLTTGTVFRRGEEYWMVMSPACDLTGREPNGSQPWMQGIHPIKAVIALRAKEEPIDHALKHATQGRTAFLKIMDTKVALNLFFTGINPAPEIFFAENAGRVTFSKAGVANFRAAQVLRSQGPSKISPKLAAVGQFEVVGQLRANYASRILQLTGSHLGRIGVDFFNLETAKRDGGHKGKNKIKEVEVSGPIPPVELAQEQDDAPPG